MVCGTGMSITLQYFIFTVMRTEKFTASRGGTKQMKQTAIFTGHGMGERLSTLLILFLCKTYDPDASH